MFGEGRIVQGKINAKNANIVLLRQSKQLWTKSDSEHNIILHLMGMEGIISFIWKFPHNMNN